MDLILGYRQSGKTTKLIEYILDWQSKVEGSVLWSGPYRIWNTQTVRSMQDAGITDICYFDLTRPERMYGMSRFGLIAIDELGTYSDNARKSIGQAMQWLAYDIVATWSLD
jgi:hypothetical protein